jgi:hypothetical protein
MICRFFGGVFGASPLVTLVGMIGDCWGLVDRGVALTGLAAATFVGPVGKLPLHCRRCAFVNNTQLDQLWEVSSLNQVWAGAGPLG